MSLDSFGDLKVLLVDPDLVAHLKMASVNSQRTNYDSRVRLVRLYFVAMVK